MLRPDGPLASPEDFAIPICCRTGPRSSTSSVNTTAVGKRTRRPHRDPTHRPRQGPPGRRRRGRRPRRSRSPGTGAGPCKFTGTDDALYERRLVFDHVVDPKDAGPREQFEAVAAAIRDVLSQRWVRTQQEYDRANPKQVYYLSMEFLIGRSLANNITNLMLSPLVDAAAREKGLRLAELLEQEPDAGLGNGGLGRLAACFIESLATMAIPAIGYGLRYDYGIFRQEIRDGSQVEHPDHWLSRPDPWEVARPNETVDGAARLPVRVARGRDLGASRAGHRTCSACRTTGRWSVTADGRSTPSASGRPRPRTSSISASSAAAISSARCRTGSSPRRSAASSTRTTRRPAADRCGSSRSTSSSPAPWPTSSPGSSAAGTTGRRCRTRSPSSSTTPTRRWPWPS